MNEATDGTNPCIRVEFDPRTRGVQVHFGPEFGNLDFALAVLGMAQRCVEDTRRVQQMHALQQQAVQQAQANHLRRSLKLG